MARQAKAPHRNSPTLRYDRMMQQAIFTPAVPEPGTEILGRWALMRTLRRNPLEIWRRIHFEAPFVAGEGPLGYGVVLSDPAAIQHVLVTNASNYVKDRLQRKVLAPGLGEGLLTAEGDAWKRTRRMLAPLFTPRAVEALAVSMLPPIEANMDRLARRPASHRHDISREMTRVTYDVLAATLFSGSIAGGAEAFSEALTRYFETQGRIDPFDMLDLPAFLPRIGRILAQPALDFFEARIEEIIAARRALLAKEAPPPRDLLTALIKARDPENGQGLTEREVGANIVTFIGAGHETTANLMSWTLYLLSQAPEIAEAVAKEARETADYPAAAALEPAKSLPMTRAVLEEAMRLFPPVPSLTRAALKRDVAAGVSIPRGALVVIAPYVLHRHTLLWDEPEGFRPQRFLPGEREAIPRFAYLPFGAGPRVCIGQQFAMVEAMLILSRLSLRFRFHHLGPPPEPVHRITLRPKGGLPMRFSLR
jgi:cytochrome P450